MKPIIQGKIVSAEELARITTSDESHGLTYEHLKRIFSEQDLQQYDSFCRIFIHLIENKSQKEQWDMVSDPDKGLSFVGTLNRIEEIRNKYKLPGKFHRIWRAQPTEDGKFKYDEIAW